MSEQPDADEVAAVFYRMEAATARAAASLRTFIRRMEQVIEEEQAG
jgi:hypothetical protein